MRKTTFLTLFALALFASLGFVSASGSYGYDDDYRDYRHDYDRYDYDDDYRYGRGHGYYTTTYMSQSAPTVDKWYTYHNTGYNQYPPNRVTLVRNGRVRYSYYWDSFRIPYRPPYHYYGSDYNSYRSYDYRYNNYNRNYHY